MIDSPLADLGARTLALVYRAQTDKARTLGMIYGKASETAQRQTTLAQATAIELRNRFDLDADEMIAELTVFDAAARLATDSRIADLLFALRSVSQVKIRRHDLGSVGYYFEQPLGTLSVVAVPEPRQSMLGILESMGGIEVNPTDVLQVTRRHAYLGLRPTVLGETLLGAFLGQVWADKLNKA